MARQAAGLLTGRTQVAIVGILRRGAPWPTGFMSGCRKPGG